MGQGFWNESTDYKARYEEEKRHREDLEWEKGQRAMREYEARQEAREEAERNRKERQAQWEMSADTWEEALQKNINRMEGELSDDPSLNKFWKGEIAASRFALDVLREEQEAVQEEIDRLQRRVYERTVERMEQAGHKNNAIKEAMLEGGPEDLLQW